MALRFPAAIDAQAFLAQYWQRKPLLLKNGLTGLLPDMTPAGLTGLACADNAEARLLRSVGPVAQWQLDHGPFCDEDFRQLAETHWTLLVQDVDKFVPAFADLLGEFSFIPSWRIDDVMISYAAPHGTVGPHIDQYDVFLIQGRGSRTWETGLSNAATVPDLPVRVLEEFTVEQRWELETGDVLYLPPGLAHHGYSDKASMTISVGFRAPSIAELLLSQAAYRAEYLLGRYEDADLTLPEASDGLISSASVERALTLLRLPPETPGQAAIWFGQLVTENKPWLEPDPVESPEPQTRFDQRLANGERVARQPGVRMAYSQDPVPGMLFVDGTAWPLDADNRSVAPSLCRGDAVPAAGTRLDMAPRKLLYELYCEGKLYWADDN